MAGSGDRGARVIVAAGFLALAAVATVIIIRYTSKDGKPEEIKIVLPEGARTIPRSSPDQTTTPPAPAKVDDAWVRRVAALPPPKQVEAVAAKLKELNPGFDGNVDPHLPDGRPADGFGDRDRRRDGHFAGAGVAGAKEPDVPGKWLRTGRLSDLSPLKGMPLTELDCGDTQVENLSPLKGMKLLTR